MLGLASPGSAQSPGSWGEIVYSCARPDIAPNWNGFCAMHADGTGRIPIVGEVVPNQERLGGGKVSPDGTRILFTSRRDDGRTEQIYVKRLDSYAEVRLTETPPNLTGPAFHNREPVWSVDGTKIFFRSERDGNREIYSMDADGSNETRLTNDPARDYQPTVLPDGRIGFVSNRSGNVDIFVTNADGTGVTNLTNNPGGITLLSPDWSPDGTRIVYIHEGDHLDVWVMNADGTGKTNLTNDATRGEFSPIWSPDGTGIAYTASPSPGSIWIMNADGTGKVNIPPGNNFGDSLTDWKVLTGTPPPPPTTTSTTAPPPPQVEPPATFAPTVNYPVGRFNPWQTAVADFNGDGVPDLAVAAPYSDHPEGGVTDGDPEGEVAILLGTGGGAFGPPTGLYAGFAPRSVAVGDFNEDGKVDLVTGNSGGRGPRNVSLLMGAGDGSFAPPVFFADEGLGTVRTRPQVVIVDDMNGDGHDDVVVANFETPPYQAEVSVMLGTGTGTLGPAAHYPSGSGLISVATGDFNGDGLRDVVTSNLLQQDMAVMLGTGGGVLGPAAHFTAAGANPHIVAVGDFNGDGVEDLAVTLLDKNAVSVLLGVGDGTFGAGVNYPVGPRPRELKVADLNGDGRLDLAVASGEMDGTNAEVIGASVLLGTGSGAFGAPIVRPAGYKPYGMAVADLDGDTWPDLVVANNGLADGDGSGSVSVIMNRSAPPAPAAPVTAVAGSALGYYTNVGLFGGPPEPRGPAPTVSLAPGGGTRTAVDPDGARADYDPALIFSSSGPLSVATKGTMGPRGYVTSSAFVADVEPGQFGASYVHSTCTAAGSTTGSTAVVKGVLILHDPNQATEGETGEEIVQLPDHPAPNSEYVGQVPGVGDDFRIVVNEQIRGSDGSLTVNAVHMYLLGPRARGELIIAQSVCAVDTGPSGAGPPAVDFDGDSTTDVGVYRPGSGVWYLDHSTAPDTAVTFGGVEGDIAVPADYDGDAKVDIAIYRPSTGVWYLDTSTAADSSSTFGISGDIPVPADYDGDAKADIAIYRPDTGVWYIDNSTAADTAVTFGGEPGDIPVVGDYDGDAKADMAVFRPSTGVWYLDNSTAADVAVTFGVNGDIPVPADYDGDAKTDIAVFRPSTGAWYLNQSTAGAAATVFGTAGDVPVLGDYDGDAKADIGVFRPSTSVWYLDRSTAADISVTFGTTGDVPLGLPHAIYRTLPLP